MSSIVFSKKDLSSLIDHQIALIERFDPDNGTCFSLIYFKIQKNFDIGDTLEKTLRKTDAIFQDDKEFVVLLSGTDWNGSLEVLKGLQNFLNQAYMETSVSYPYDGTDSKTLMDKLQVIVRENYGRSSEILRRK